MVQKWRGDGNFVLPAGMIEPYRLWFEYLKLAHADASITVSQNAYGDWGDVVSTPFSPWWSQHWRDLFAVRSTVTRVVEGTIVHDDPHSLTLNIPLTGNIDATLTQIASLLRTKDVTHGAQGKYGLSAGYEKGLLKHIAKARRYLRLYGYWLKYADLHDRRRVERAAKDYTTWSRMRDDKVRAELAKKRAAGIKDSEVRRIPYTPAFYIAFTDYLMVRDANKGRRVTQATFDPANAENARRQIVRDIRNARRLAENVATGVFPGSY